MDDTFCISRSFLKAPHQAGMYPTAQFGENPILLKPQMGCAMNRSLDKCPFFPPLLSPGSASLTPQSLLLLLSFIKFLWSWGLFFLSLRNSFWLTDFRSVGALNFSLLFWINTVLHFFSFHFWGPTTELFYISFSSQDCLKMELMQCTWIFCLLLADLISMETIIHAIAWIIYFTVVKV